MNDASAPKGLPPLAAFLLLSLLWGLTWTAGKVALAAWPPLFLAGTRFTAAGLMLVAVQAARGGLRELLRPAREWPWLLVVALLLTPLSYGPLFWGMQRTPSGLAAVVNLGVIPPILAVLGVVSGAERMDLRRTIAVGLGVAGLTLAFWPGLKSHHPGSVSGLLAIVSGSFAYCVGSIVSVRTLAHLRPITLSAWVMLLGGLMLLPASLLTEPVGPAAYAAFAQPGPMASWLFLTIGGSLIGFTLYLDLLRRWGPVRAGFYAFVSPLIALAAGWVLLGETIGPVEALGCGVLVAATVTALTRRRAPVEREAAA